MRGALRVRERSCPTCAATARGAEARWCGRCGAALDPDGEAARADGEAGSSRRLGALAGVRSRPPLAWSLRTLAVVAGVGAVVALLVGGGGLVDRAASERSGAVEDVAVAAPEPDLVARVEERPPPAPLPDRTDPVCARGGTDDCFLWTAAVPPTVGELGHHHALDELVLTSEGPELVARDLATGEVRWRTDELGALTPYQAEVVDGVLVVAGEDRRAVDIHAATAVAAGLDATTGEVRWREGALSASLGAGGTTVLTTGEGQLRAHGPDGELRWEADERIDSRVGAGAWAVGHVVSVYDGSGEARLLRLTDGSPLDLEGHAIASDATATVLELPPDGGDGGDGSGGAEGSGGPGYALVDEGGEVVWRVGGLGVPWCSVAARLGPSAVELETCGGARVDLLREDGSAVDVGSAEGDRTSSSTTLQLGAYEFVYRDRSAAAGYPADLLVVDVTSGREVALLPPETWPIWPRTDRVDVSDVVLLASPDRLIALPPAVRHGNGRSSGTSELRSLWPPASLSVRPR